MPLLTRFASLLDRFEERLGVDCERLKHQLVAQVDQQFGVLRSNVRELRSRFCGGHVNRTFSPVDTDLLFNDPPVEIVQFNECIQEPQPEHAALMNQPSSSTGRKRKLSQVQSGGPKKRTITSANVSNRKYACKFVGCDRSFVLDIELARHERIHLDIRPFACTWPDCRIASRNRCDLVRHVRVAHFQLPNTVKKQLQLNIADERDPNEFIRVDTAQLNRHWS